MFHVNLLTGVIAECVLKDECKIPKNLHYNDYPNALIDYEAVCNSSLYYDYFTNYSHPFTEALEKALENGLVRGQTPAIEEHQINLLKFNESVIELIKMYYGSDVKQNFKSKILKAIAWAVKEGEDQIDGKDFKGRLEVFAPLLTQRDYNSLKIFGIFNDVGRDELLSVSLSLWQFNYSPLHDYAKYLIYGGEYSIGGYIPTGVLEVNHYDNKKYFHEFKIDETLLKSNIVAFDIETDTTYGYGLLPHKTQITEIVLSTINDTVVVSGDERLILEYLVKYFNGLDGDKVLVGWNNECFDNIVLQCRAEFHNISGWLGVVEPSRNYTIFEPSGPSGDSCKFHWGGVGSLDLFQRKIYENSENIIGLKNFVVENGGDPLQVDRRKLHLLTDHERNLYSLSDGLATLYAASLILK